MPPSFERYDPFTSRVEVYRTPELEVPICRTPDGFTDEEVVEILAVGPMVLGDRLWR